MPMLQPQIESRRFDLPPILARIAHRWLVASCYLALLMPLVVVPWVLFPYTFGKAIYLSTGIAAALPALILVRTARPLERNHHTPITLALLLYVCAMAIATTFSIDPLRSFWGNAERGTGLWLLIHYALLFFALSSVFRSVADWTRVLTFSVGVAFVVSVLAFLQKFGLLTPLHQGSERASSLIGNPAFLAEYLFFNIFFTLWLAVRPQKHRTRYLLMALLLTQTAALALTETRAAVIGLYSAVCVYVGLNAALQGCRGSRSAFALAALVLALAPIAAWTAASHPYFKEMPGLKRFSGLSWHSVNVEARLINWSIALQGFTERPITGWGPETYRYVFDRHYKPRVEQLAMPAKEFDHPHNKPLELLCDAGLIGAMAFVCCVFLVLAHLISSRRLGVLDVQTFSVALAVGVGYLVQSLFLFDHPIGLLMLSVSLAWWHSIMPLPISLAA